MGVTCITSLIPSSSVSIVVIVTLFYLLPSAHCLGHKQPTGSFRGLVMEDDKARLGSMPPTCHNKCNHCHPCRAAQVPSMRIPAGFESSPQNPYSNYKPLGWKCRCGSHFYDP